MNTTFAIVLVDLRHSPIYRNNNNNDDNNNNDNNNSIFYFCSNWKRKDMSHSLSVHHSINSDNYDYAISLFFSDSN